LGLALAKFLQRKRRDSVAPFLEIRLATSHWLSATSRLLKFLVKFAGRAGNINPARDTALAILGPLHDAGIFPAFRASGGFAGVHDLLTVRCLCDLRHILLLTGMCRRPVGRGSTWCLGSNSGVLTGRMGTLEERASVLANSSLHDRTINERIRVRSVEHGRAPPIVERRARPRPSNSAPTCAGTVEVPRHHTSPLGRARRPSLHDQRAIKSVRAHETCLQHAALHHSRAGDHRRMDSLAAA